MTWSKDGSTSLPEGATAGNDGALRIEGRSNQIDGRYNLDVTNAYGRVSTPVTIRWREASKSHPFEHLDTPILNTHLFAARSNYRRPRGQPLKKH